MQGYFKCLFVLPKNKEQNSQEYFSASKHFPVVTHFEYSHESALSYLKNCSPNNFPSVIIIEDEMGFEKNTEFIKKYRAQFYLFNMDTLLFNCSANSNNQQYVYSDLIAQALPLPFNKKAFMEHVFPLLTVYMH